MSSSRPLPLSTVCVHRPVEVIGDVLNVAGLNQEH